MITTTKGCTTITGAGIPLFRLLALRSAVDLQLRTGIQFGRRSIVALACRELGCKRKDVRAALDAAVKAAAALNAAEQK